MNLEDVPFISQDLSNKKVHLTITLQKKNPNLYVLVYFIFIIYIKVTFVKSMILIHAM